MFPTHAAVCKAIAVYNDIFFAQKSCDRLSDRYINRINNYAIYTAIQAHTAFFTDRTAVRAGLIAPLTNICAVFAPQAASAQDCAISAKFVTIIAQVCAFFADQADIAHKCAISANFITIFAQGCAFFAQPAKTAKVEAIHTVIAIFTHYDAVITGVATGAELLVAFGAGSPAYLAYRDTFGTVHSAAAAQNHIASTLSAGFAVTACTIVTQFAGRTVHGIIVYITGIAVLAGCTFRMMAIKAAIVTAFTAHATAIKTAEANHAVGAIIETFTAISAMSMVFYGTIKAHFASITPTAAFAAGLIAHRTTRCVAQTCSAGYTVVCFVAIAAAGLAAVISAIADVVIAADFAAKFAIYHRIPCICSCRKHSCKYYTAQQNTKQIIQFHFCFHKQFLLVSFRYFAG